MQGKGVSLASRECAYNISTKILCANSRDWTEIRGALSKNVFLTSPAPDGAITGPYEKMGPEVHLLHSGGVCAKFRCHRANNAGY